MRIRKHRTNIVNYGKPTHSHLLLSRRVPGLSWRLLRNPPVPMIGTTALVPGYLLLQQHLKSQLGPTIKLPRTDISSCKREEEQAHS